MFGENAYYFIEYRQPLPEFSNSFASKFVVTAWTEDGQEPTYYLDDINCHRDRCDSLTLKNGAQTIEVTGIEEGEEEGKVKIEITDETSDILTSI